MPIGTQDPCTSRYVTLDRLTTNPRLARHPLWSAAATLCRWLRIAVTVTDPDDAVAREKVMTALGMEPCVVRGDPATVDAFSAKVWPEKTYRPLRLLVCPQASSIAGGVRAYAQAVGELLGAHISYFHTHAGAGVALDARPVGQVAPSTRRAPWCG